MGSVERRDLLSEHSTFLFKVPSWFDGIGPIVDISGQHYYRYATSPGGVEADRRAFQHDAQAVAGDLVEVLSTTLKQLP